MEDKPTLRIHDLFGPQLFAEIETLYHAVKKSSRAEEGLSSLETVESFLDKALADAESSGLDKILTDQISQQHQKAKDVILRLKRYLEDLMEEGTSQRNVDVASSFVENLHLLTNSMRDIAFELDRHYERKPHLMFGPESRCCGLCSCSQKEDQEK